MIIKVHNTVNTILEYIYQVEECLMFHLSLCEVKNGNNYDLNVIKNQSKFGIKFSVSPDPVVEPVSEPVVIPKVDPEVEFEVVPVVVPVVESVPEVDPEVVPEVDPSSFVVSEELVEKVNSITLSKLKTEQLRTFVTEFGLPCNISLPRFYLYKEVKDFLETHGVI